MFFLLASLTIFLSTRLTEVSEVQSVSELLADAVADLGGPAVTVPVRGPVGVDQLLDASDRLQVQDVDRKVVLVAGGSSAAGGWKIATIYSNVRLIVLQSSSAFFRAVRSFVLKHCAYEGKGDK